MRKKYKVKKKYTVSVLTIIIIAVLALVIVNIGYSMWSSRLSIYGKVSLDFNPPVLETTVVPIEQGKYVNITGLTNDLGVQLFDLVSEEYKENELVTTLKVHENLATDWLASDVTVNFSLKNNSSSGYVYTDGKVTQVEVANPGGALKNVNAGLVPVSISSGQTAVFNFSANVNRAGVKDSTYYKYAITYKVNDITRYFFYTIKILE